MQIPIINGIYVDNVDFRTAYPVNMIPVPKSQGISEGYLRPADGILHAGDGTGIDRGSTNWKGVCYRVMGDKLIRIAENMTFHIIGYVGDDGKQVTFAYSFDRLAIASNERLYYWDDLNLTQVTDFDLGKVLDLVWIDGYFMTTDGENLVVTELNDPTSINPLKYGSSEIDPDPIVALLKHRNEVYALNRYTIEAFDNVGGNNFPFSRIDGAMIEKGCIGTHACCIYNDTIAFLGSGRNEQISLYVGQNSQVAKIATREIEQILGKYSEDVLENVILESRMVFLHSFLYIHLPDQTLVYDSVASGATGEAVWHILVGKDGTYNARNFVWCYNKWIVGSATDAKYGVMTEDWHLHYNELVSWSFSTKIMYNESRGAIFHDLELIALPTSKPVLPGLPEFSLNELNISFDPNAKGSIYTQYSLDGITWSQPRIHTSDRWKFNQRINWMSQGIMRNFRIQRFYGDSLYCIPVARLEARIEALGV